MMTLIALVVAGSLLFLAGLHVYWGFSGQWGALVALPKKPDGTLLFRPGRIACGVVASGLGAVAWLALAQRDIVALPLAAALMSKLLWAVAGGFLLRSVGDFRYVGFFRRVCDTDFGVMDRKYFTPLCVGYAIAFSALALNP